MPDELGKARTMRKDIRTVTVGVDGSRAGLDAADWAAREAERRRLTLRLLHASGEPAAASAPGQPRRSILDRAAVQLSYAHPTLDIAARRTDTSAVPALLEVATESETVVLGSRGFGGFTGFLVGSVALAVAAGAACPVVLVRAGELPLDERALDEHVSDQYVSGQYVSGQYVPDERIPDEHLTVGTVDDATPPARAPYLPVVLGLDPDDPADDVVGYAFDAAAVRHAPLHVLHTWTLPPLRDCADGGRTPVDTAGQQEARESSLAAVLGPWRHKFPEIEVSEEVVYGRAGHHLLKASTRAGLLVVGRASADRGLGRVADSLVHHSTCPVAVVPHA